MPEKPAPFVAPSLTIHCPICGAAAPTQSLLPGGAGPGRRDNNPPPKDADFHTDAPAQPAKGLDLDDPEQRRRWEKGGAP
jgi:hypothetical protein